MGPDLWNPVIDHMPAREIGRVDLGYYGAPELPEVNTPLVITHSLGLMWSLMHIPRPWHGLICINSFTRFAAAEGFPGVDPHWLRRMKKRLQQDPAAVVTDFLRRCGKATPATMGPMVAHTGTPTQELSPLQAMQPNTQPPLPRIPSPQRLLQGLEWLEQEDLRVSFQSIDCPVLAICGEADLIVNAAHSRACFSHVPLIMREEAGHLMPETHAPWLAKRIMAAADGNWSS